MERIVVHQVSNELEVVMQARTDSFIGFGWKPFSESLSVFTLTYSQFGFYLEKQICMKFYPGENCTEFRGMYM